MNAVFNAFAYIENYETSENLNKQNDLLNIYMRCCCVSLISAKYNGNAIKDDCQLILVTNIDVPQYYSNIFEKENIIIKKVPFDRFMFDENMKWSLAFYKLCALKHIVESGEYDKVMLVDSDTYFANDINDIWIEAEQNILLYDICHSLKNHQMIQMNKEYKLLYGKDTILVNYGGEFVCGKCSLLKQYISECEAVYKNMIEKNVMTLHGDEFIWCAAAIKFKSIIKSANAYIDRYWTGKRVYRVSTNYYFDPVCIYHFPVEKKYGIRKTFNYYIRHNKMPELNKIIRWYSLPSTKRGSLIKDILKLFKKI